MSIQEACELEEYISGHFISAFSWFNDYGYTDNVRMKRSSPNTFSTLLKHKKRTPPTNYHHIKTMVKNNICNNKSEVLPRGSQVINSRSQKYSKGLEITKTSKIFFICYANIHTEIYVRRWCFGRPYTCTRIQVSQH